LAQDREEEVIYAGTIMGVVGFGILAFSTDWLIATAVFLMIWGNNLEQRK
jgi:hypothetical protein